MATSRTAVSASAVTDTLHRTLVWLDVRLGLLFAVGVPLVLLVWAMLRRQQAITRLLGLYWTVASLQLIALLLLVGRQAVGYLLVFVAQLLIAAVLWFWVDLNEELQDLPPGAPCRSRCASGAGVSRFSRWPVRPWPAQPWDAWAARPRSARPVAWSGNNPPAVQRLDRPRP